jgi:hypothetical protein
VYGTFPAIFYDEPAVAVVRVNRVYGEISDYVVTHAREDRVLLDRHTVMSHDLRCVDHATTVEATGGLGDVL